MSTWRYEAATKTIRSVPGNHWIASTDSWDKAVDHEKSAALIAAAPELLEALKLLEHEMEQSGNATADDFGWSEAIKKTRAAIAKAEEAYHG